MGNLALKFQKNAQVGENTAWKEHLLIQRDITNFVDQQLLFTDQDWTSSKKILDIGCGYGYQTEFLAKHSPDKKFLGIDIDEKAVSSAQANTSTNNVKYKVLDINKNVKQIGKFDCIVTTLVLQHLPNLENYLKFCEKNLTKKGVIFIIDTYDELRRMSGLEEELKHIYFKLKQSQKNMGSHRNALILLPNLLHKFGFSLEREKIISGIAGKEISKSALARLYQINLSIVHNKYKVDLDLDKWNKKLDKWLNNPKSFGSITCHCLKLRKV